MTVPAPPGSHERLIRELRAAGCVFAEDEAGILLEAATSADELASMLRQRVAGLPLEHIVGWAEFAGLRIAVGAGVFVPRVRTEFLVRQAVEQAVERAVEYRVEQAAATTPRRRRPVILDMCCGAGAIGAAVSHALDGDIELHAADIDPAAVACARRNVTGADAHVYEGDLYVPLPESLRGRVDVLIANAPYVPTGEIGYMPPEARAHEALVALDGGADGLDVQRRVTAEAAVWLAPGGRLLIETSERQAAETAAVFARHGLDPRVVSDEEYEATVVIGTWTASSH